MAASALSYQGVDVEEAYGALQKAGIHAEAAKSIIGVWVGEAVRAGRTFGYSHSFPAVDPACAPAPFARTFVHQDWVDGESAVQAGQTPTEQGFNERFHRIERDLDRLGALVAQAFTCMNAMRANLSGSLGEIAAELNRIDGDLAELRRSGPATVSPGLGTIDKNFRFIGKTKYFDKTVMVWQDNDGRMVTLPDVTTISLPPAAEARAPKAAEVLGRDADIRAAFPGPVTKQELVERFGGRPTQDGQRLADVLSTIPDEQSFATLDAMVSQLGEQDVALLHGVGAASTVRAELGVDPGASAADAAVTKLEGVPPALGAALADAGVRTVGQLGALSSEKLVEIGRQKSIDVSPGAAAGLLARSRVMGKL